MKKRVIFIALIYIILISIVTLVFIGKISDNPNNDMFRKQLVELKEIQTIIDNSSDDESNELVKLLTESVEQSKIILRETIQKNETNAKLSYILTECFICIMFVITVFAYVYISILHPFDKMKGFANEIANGNFNIPLKYERSNYFGAFTWAFDNMRKEVITARQNEKKAILKNKTVIATISHDIKTPITSIRAYSEALASNQGQNMDKEAKYISVILRKCDEVTNLTNDLLLHSISDLDKLKMESKHENIRQLLIAVLNDNNTEEFHINVDKNIPESVVMLDKQRFDQVIGNIISNSIKYAGTDIDVSCEIKDNDYVITIRDYGKGIPDENMPFVFDKFYRGDNVGDKAGSGLGLYITEYIMEKHNGNVKLFNHEDGLEAILSFPICKE